MWMLNVFINTHMCQLKQLVFMTWVYNFLQTKLSPTTSNLLGLLAENGRLGKLEAVINAFKIMMAAHRGEVTCVVTTAKPLDVTQRQNLEAALKVHTGYIHDYILSRILDGKLLSERTNPDRTTCESRE